MKVQAFILFTLNYLIAVVAVVPDLNQRKDQKGHHYYIQSLIAHHPM